MAAGILKGIPVASAEHAAGAFVPQLDMKGKVGKWQNRQNERQPKEL